jgi:hypothetical protein
LSYEVECINKTDWHNPHEQILKIGGFNSDGTRWKLDQQEVIKGMGEGKWSFYVTKHQKTVKVITAKSPYGHKC